MDAGRAGCLEAYASGTALTRSVRAAAASEPAAAGRLLERAGGDPERIDGPTIIAAALEGDPMAVAGLREVGAWLGRGLAQVAAVLDPSVLVVGGGLAEAAGELIADPARAAYAEAVSIPAVRPLAPIRLATARQHGRHPRRGQPWRTIRNRPSLNCGPMVGSAAMATRTRWRQSGVR